MGRTQPHPWAQKQGAITQAQFQAIGELAPSLLQSWFRELDHPADDCLDPALVEKCSALLLTQDQRLLRKVLVVPQASGLVMDLGALELSH